MASPVVPPVRLLLALSAWMLFVNAPAGAQSADGETTAAPKTAATETSRPMAHSPCEQAEKLRKAGKRKEAIKLLQQAVEKDPMNGLCRYYLGVAQFEDGRAEEALENLKRSVDSAPDKAEGLYWLGRARAEMGDESGAIEVWRMALEKDPTLAQAHYHIALLLKKQGDTAGARRELEAALKIRPEYKAAQRALRNLKK